MDRSIRSTPPSSMSPPTPDMTAQTTPSSSSKKQFSMKPPGRPSRERFSKQDIEFILTWMEHRPNFESVIVGSSGRTAPGEPRKFKSHGYSALAQAVSKNSNGRLNINGKAMRERFQRHLKLYQEVKKEANSVRFSITEEDAKKGLATTAQKLESMCACYARMDALFSNRLRSKIAPIGQGIPAALQELDERPTAAVCERNEHRKTGTVPQYQFIGEEDAEDEEDEDEEDENEEGEEDIGHTENGTSNSYLIDARESRVGGSIPTSAADLRRAKHSLADTESEFSSKRSRTNVRRKKYPTFDRTPFSYEQSYTTRVSALETIEAKMLELEAEKLALEKAKESKRQELEAKKLRLEMEKLEHDKEKASKRQALEERKLKLEEKKLENEFQREKLQLAMTGLAQGMSIEQIQKLINTLLTK